MFSGTTGVETVPVENCTPGYTWHTQGPAGRPMVLPLPSRHSLSGVHRSPIKSDMCDRTVEHCRGNDIKFNWRSSIKLAIKTARTQRIPARLAFYEPSSPISPSTAPYAVL